VRGTTQSGEAGWDQMGYQYNAIQRVPVTVMT
jgi:hypothetical protein